MIYVSEIIAGCSAIGACSAVFVAWNQSRLTHKHNVLSVRPLLELSLEYSLTDYTVKIRNKGLGPAIIKNVLIRLDEIKQSSENNYINTIDKTLRFCLKDSAGRISKIDSSNFDNQKIIKENEGFIDFDVQFVHNTQPSAERTIKSFEKVQIEIEYEDFYCNKQSTLRFSNQGLSSWKDISY